MIKVVLTDAEVLICRIIGNLRSLNKRLGEIDDAGSTNDDDEVGLIGEYAFGKHYNLFMDLSLHQKKGGGDFVRNGKVIDVKATTRPDGNLVSPLSKLGTTDVDVYVLAIVNNNEVDLIGYATREEFLREENIRDLGKSRGFFYPRSKLRELP